jgi:hypothetical protein
MTREDIIRMAKNSGLFVELVLERDLDWLERFAALVASAECERVQKVYENAATDAVKAAIKQERESCLKLANSLGWVNVDHILARL